MEWLPRHVSDLNDIEGVWRGLKRHHLAYQRFTGVDDLDAATHTAAGNLNHERRVIHPCDNLRIVA